MPTPMTVPSQVADMIEASLRETLTFGVSKFIAQQRSDALRRETHGETIVLWYGVGPLSVCVFCGAVLDKPAMPPSDAPPSVEFKLTCRACTPRLKTILDSVTGVLSRREERRAAKET